MQKNEMIKGTGYGRPKKKMFLTHFPDTRFCVWSSFFCLRNRTLLTYCDEKNLHFHFVHTTFHQHGLSCIITFRQEIILWQSSEACKLDSEKSISFQLSLLITSRNTYVKSLFTYVKILFCQVGFCNIKSRH